MFRLKYNGESGIRPLWFYKNNRRESGRYAWRGWMGQSVTDQPDQAMVWKTRKGVDGFLEKYPSVADRFTVEEVTP
jgi:hypothetical protein